jgi:ParB/RepB/Spo0J family partition protein
MGGQALSYKRGQTFDVPADDIIIIGLDTKDGPEHILWQERATLPVEDSMVADIKERGVLEPVGLRKDGKNDEGNDRLLCVFGRQRVKAARKAGVPVKSMIIKDDDHGVFLMALSENSHRQDNDVITNAQEAHRAINVHKIEIAKVALATNASVQTVKSWLKWFDLDRSVQKAVERGKVAFTAAVELAELERSEQKKKLEELLAEGGTVTVSKTRRAKHDVKSRKGKSKSTTHYDPPHKRRLRKIVEHGNTYGLPTTFLSALRYVVGETSGSNITGLTKLLRDIDEGKI